MNGRSVLYINPLLLNAFLYIFFIISSYYVVRQCYLQNCPFAHTLRCDDKDNLRNIRYIYPKSNSLRTLVVIFFFVILWNLRYMILNRNPGFTKSSLMFPNKTTFIELRVKHLLIYCNLTCEVYTFGKTVNTIITPNHRILLGISRPPLGLFSPSSGF